MEKLKKAGRIAYCIGMVGMVIPQFFYGQFGNNFFPPWPGLHGAAIGAFLFSIAVIAACIAIAFEIKPKMAALYLGGLLLAMYILGDLPYQLFVDPHPGHLYSWTDLLKELALAGGAFAVAGSFPRDAATEKLPLIKQLEKLIPWGSCFFCITMIAYGLCHFLYIGGISTMVPDWIPGHIFWTYFAGAALIAAGICIVFRAWLNIAALLLSIMIFLWLIMIHIPRAIHDPLGNHANEPVSAFSALAFSGIALVIACTPRRTR